MHFITGAELKMHFFFILKPLIQIRMHDSYLKLCIGDKVITHGDHFTNYLIVEEITKSIIN